MPALVPALMFSFVIWLIAWCAVGAALDTDWPIVIGIAPLVLGFCLGLCAGCYLAWRNVWRQYRGSTRGE